MKKIINKMLKKSQKINLWDWALLKITLIAFGILIGTYISFNAYIICIWFIALSGLIMLYYTFCLKKK